MPDVTACYGAPLILLCFFGIFIHNLRSFIPELLYIHLTLTDCISDQCNVNIPNVTASYGRFSDSIAFSGLLHYNFTNCVIRQM